MKNNYIIKIIIVSFSFSVIIRDLNVLGSRVVPKDLNLSRKKKAFLLYNTQFVPIG